MSAGGLSVRALASPDVPSISLKWLEMKFGSDDAATAAAPVPDKPTVDGKGSAEARNAAVQVNELTNDTIKKITDPLNFISVIGPARSGKSTLMNFLSGSKSELFPTSPGAITFTKGIYIPSKVLSLQDFSTLEKEPVIDAGNYPIKISFVDTEGQGAMGNAYDMNLFSSALLCSKVVIYNRTGGLLTAQILDQLLMMADAGQRLLRDSTGAKKPATNGTTTVSGAGSSDNKTKPFGHLVLLFNRFQLSPGFDISTLESELLGEEGVTDSSSSDRNKIRKLLADCFTSISIYILPDNQLKSEVLDEMETNKDRFLTIDDFRPKYLDYFKKLRTGLSQMLSHPQELVPGNPLTGGAIADFVPSFADAINRQAPLNVPSLFESSRNDAVNKALIKFKRDLENNLDNLAKDPGSPSRTLDRKLDSEIGALMADLDTSLSYMPAETLDKLHKGASAAAAPLKAANMATNLVKLQNDAAKDLLIFLTSMRQFIDLKYGGQNILVSKTDLDSSFKQFQSTTVANFKDKWESADPQSLPQGSIHRLDDAITAEKVLLDQRHEKAWKDWIDQQTLKELTTLRGTLDELVSEISAGDQKRWDSTVLKARETARDNFRTSIKAQYQGNDPDGVEKKFSAEVDEAIKAREAMWKSNEEDIKAGLKKKLKTSQTTYLNKLANSIAPNSQPPVFTDITNPKTEREQLENYIKNAKITEALSSDALEDFDNFVAKTKSEYLASWNSATTTFNNYISSQVKQRLEEWVADYEKSLDAVKLTTTAAKVEIACNESFTTLETAFQGYRNSLGPLQNDSLAALTLNGAAKTVANAGATGKISMLTKFDELATLYNRALLSKLLKSTIEKTLSETDSYRNVEALNQALAPIEASFLNKEARSLSSSEGETPAQQWNNFKTKMYPGLVDNVKRNGEAYGIDGAKDSFDLQVQVLKNCMRIADIANALGMSWISSGTFGSTPEDKGTSGDSQSEIDKPKSRKIYLANTNNPNGYWSDRKTSLSFYDWAVEPSDYILGKPVITELKPSLIASNQYPSSKTARTATVGSTYQAQETVSNSRTVEHGWGVKATLGVESTSKMFGTGITVKTALETSYNGKIANTTGGSFGNTFTVSGSSTVDLPPNRINTVTQVAFDQKTTIPYTALMRLAPKVKFEHGFVRAGGVYLKRDYFESNKDNDRVTKDFELPRLDQLRDYAKRNEGPWDWPRFFQDGYGWMLDELADPSKYTFYVKGKWEGLTGKLVITTVTPSDTKYELLPNDQ